MTSKTLRIQRVANGWMIVDDSPTPHEPVAFADTRVAATVADLVDIVENWASVQIEEPNTDTEAQKKEKGKY